MWRWARVAPPGDLETRDVSIISVSSRGNRSDVKLLWGRAVERLALTSLNHDKAGNSLIQAIKAHLVLVSSTMSTELSSRDLTSEKGTPGPRQF